MLVSSFDRVFPLVLVSLMGASCLTSCISGKWLDGLYWAGAVILNLSILLR